MGEKRPIIRDHTTPVAPVLVRRPSGWVAVLLLVAGVLGRTKWTMDADAAAQATAFADSTRKIVESRLRDSVALAAKVNAGTPLRGRAVIELDAAVHAAPFVIAHGSLHEQANRVRLDSAAKLLRARAGVPSEIQHLLSEVREPLTTEQTRTVARLRGNLARVLERKAARRVQRKSLRTP